MLVHIFLLSVLLFSTIESDKFNGNLCILTSPSGYLFTSLQKPIGIRTAKNIFAVATGNPKKAHKSRWKGMTIKNPFCSGDIVIALQLEAFEGCELGNLKLNATFKVDADVDKIREFLQSLPEDSRNANNIKLDVENANSIGSIFKSNSYETVKTNLDLNVKENYKFVKEINMIAHITKNLDKIKEPKRIDVFWFKIKSFAPFMKKHRGSFQAQTGLNTLGKHINALKTEFAKYYNVDNLMFVMISNTDYYRNTIKEKEENRGYDITSEESKEEEPPNFDWVPGQRARQGDETIAAWEEEFMIRYYKIDNFMEDHIDDYSVETHLFLWPSLGLVFSLIAACLFIMDMDVGRDTAIYRLTEPRKR